MRRSHHEHRLAIVARTQAEAIKELETFLRGDRPAGRRPPSRRPRCVFVFSGQGSQWWGMGRDLAETEPVAREVLEDLDRRFLPWLGWSIQKELAASESESRLDQTGHGQPAVFALQIALAALWRSWGIEPDAVVGHSLGEVAAAYVAGALGLDDAIRVVAHRARLMQSTVRSGQPGAAAVALSACRRRRADRGGSDPDRLALAAVNGPGASVISGEAGAVRSNSLPGSASAGRLCQGAQGSRCALPRTDDGPRSASLRSDRPWQEFAPACAERAPAYRSSRP